MIHSWNNHKSTTQLNPAGINWSDGWINQLVDHTVETTAFQPSGWFNHFPSWSWLNQLEWLFQSAINQAWLKQCGWNNSPLFSDVVRFYFMDHSHQRLFQLHANKYAAQDYRVLFSFTPQSCCMNLDLCSPGCEDFLSTHQAKRILCHKTNKSMVSGSGPFYVWANNYPAR